MMAERILSLDLDGKRQHGLATVEFAIALPLIIFLALAVTELGRGLYQYNTLTKAVRDGARYLSNLAIDAQGIINIDPLNNTLIADTKNIVVYGDIDGGTPVLPNFAPANVTVSAVDVPLPGGGISPNHIQVSASYTFTPLFPALSVVVGPTMTASTVERALKI